jgi:spore germination protein KA
MGGGMFGRRKNRNSAKDNKINKDSKLNEAALGQSLSKKIDDNIDMFKKIFDNDETLVIRRFQNKHLSAAKCCVIYFDAMLGLDIINENVIKPGCQSNKGRLFFAKDRNNSCICICYYSLNKDYCLPSCSVQGYCSCV